MNTRINLNDNLLSVIHKMSDGNPGSMSAMMAMVEESPRIDPDAVMGGIAPLMTLDMAGIYGADIYILWNDYCGRDTAKALGVLRATQLGFFSRTELAKLCKMQDRSGVLDVEGLCQRVKGRIANFKA